MDLETKRKQAADQCRAVAHMARILNEVHADYARLFDEGALEGLEDQVGERTACLMQTLGDMMNRLDAVTRHDEWINPIFERSREVFPEKICPTCEKPVPHGEWVGQQGHRYHFSCFRKS